MPATDGAPSAWPSTLHKQDVRPLTKLPYYHAMPTSPSPLVNEPEPRRGSLACVGLGMTLGSHLTPLARSHIQQADVVFAGLSDGVVELWLQRMHADVRSLQPYYREGKSRMKTYREWVFMRDRSSCATGSR